MARTEDRIIYTLLIAIGIIPVAIALASDRPFGWDATAGLVMASMGLVGLGWSILTRS